MDWEQMKEQLQSILKTHLSITKVTEAVWNRATNESPSADSAAQSVVQENKVLFYLENQGRDITALQVDQEAISESERRLIELTVETKRSSAQKKQQSGWGSEDERRALAIGEWLKQQMEQGVTNAETPDALTAQVSLYSNQVPILLYGEYSPVRRVHYADLKKLLESFFDIEIALIPLMEKEWLILASETILAGASNEDKDSEEEDSLEQNLEDLCGGLYDMLSNEWVGECHLSIHYPIKPVKSLLAAVSGLRETMMLGKTYHIADNVHFPWNLQLEKLLHLIPDAEKELFLEKVLNRMDYAVDNETLMTLEMFFSLDCNVSETAKKLYIHRNTLLYRLDKFKGEAGYDVRTFSDAVLVKLALLLYKVTKRI